MSDIDYLTNKQIIDALIAESDTEGGAAYCRYLSDKYNIPVYQTQLCQLSRSDKRNLVHLLLREIIDRDTQLV